MEQHRQVPRSYHLDGSWYQHHLFCPQQAIIVCPVLTEARRFCLFFFFLGGGEKGGAGRNFMRPWVKTSTGCLLLHPASVQTRFSVFDAFPDLINARAISNMFEPCRRKLAMDSLEDCSQRNVRDTPGARFHSCQARACPPTSLL